MYLYSKTRLMYFSHVFTFKNINKKKQNHHKVKRFPVRQGNGLLPAIFIMVCPVFAI